MCLSLKYFDYTMNSMIWVKFFRRALDNYHLRCAPRRDVLDS